MCGSHARYGEFSVSCCFAHDCSGYQTCKLIVVSGANAAGCPNGNFGNRIVTSTDIACTIQLPKYEDPERIFGRTKGLYSLASADYYTTVAWIGYVHRRISSPIAFATVHTSCSSNNLTILELAYLQRTRVPSWGQYRTMDHTKPRFHTAQNQLRVTR